MMVLALVMVLVMMVAASLYVAASDNDKAKR